MCGFVRRHRHVAYETARSRWRRVGAAKRSDLLCHARTVRRRTELIFTEITATDADGEVVTHAIQTYRVV